MTRQTNTKIDESTVARVAGLARLELSDAEAKSMLTDMAAIVGYIDLLEDAPTDGVRPLVHTTIDAAPQREDVVQATLTPDEALANAPQAAGGCFVVPRMVVK